MFYIEIVKKYEEKQTFKQPGKLFLGRCKTTWIVGVGVLGKEKCIRKR